MDLTNIDSQGIIYLQGEVDSKMYETAIKGLAELSYVEDIVIVLNTEGGCVYQALAIHDAIKLSTVPVRILCCGPVMSAGVIILAAAEKRVATKNAQFMIHYGQEENDSVSTVKHNQYLYNLMKRIVKDITNVSPRRLTSWFKTDTFLTATEALEYGLITRIAE